MHLCPSNKEVRFKITSFLRILHVDNLGGL